MSVYEGNVAKMATKKAWKLDRTRDRTTVRPLPKKIHAKIDRLLLCFREKMRVKKLTQKSIDSCCLQAKKIAGVLVAFSHLRTHSGI